MNKELLEEAGINYPIKLEYYKITNKEEAKYGINVVKTEYKKENTIIENKKIQYISNNDKKVEEILNILKESEVTPIAVEDVLSDFNVNFA